MKNGGRIYKTSLQENFTILPNEALQRNDMSWGAKGLLSFLLSLPEDWDLYKNNLNKFATNGRDSTNKPFDELREKGYVKGVQRREKGVIKGWDWFVSPEPIYLESNQKLENQSTENQSTENQSTENQSLENRNTENPKTENPKTGIQSVNKERSKKENNNKERTNKETVYESFDFFFSNDSFKDTYSEFLKMRKSVKAPMTQRAEKILLNKLVKMSDNNIDLAVELLEQSIVNNWKGIFPLKNNSSFPYGKSSAEKNESLFEHNNRIAQSVSEKLQDIDFDALTDRSKRVDPFA